MKSELLRTEKRFIKSYRSLNILAVTFEICKLTSFGYLILPNRSLLVAVTSVWFKIIQSILAILLRKMFP